MHADDVKVVVRQRSRKPCHLQPACITYDLRFITDATKIDSPIVLHTAAPNPESLRLELGCGAGMYSHLGGVHEEGVCVGGVRHHMVEGEHAQLEERVVAAGGHVSQGQARQQLGHGLPILPLIHHLCK